MKHWYTSASFASVASVCEMISFHCLEPDLPILENWFKLILCNLSVISLGASACDKWPWFRDFSAWFKCWIRGVSACDVFKCWIGTIKSSSSEVISLLRSLEISSFYANVPKIMITCYTAPAICVTDVILIFYFGLCFALLPP